MDGSPVNTTCSRLEPGTAVRVRRLWRWSAWSPIVAVVLATWFGREPVWGQEKTFEVRDTLRVVEDQDADVEAVLGQLRYELETFSVQAKVMENDRLGRVMLQYPSPSRGVEAATLPGDDVAMVWHVARDDKGEPMKAPAMLIVHSMHPQAVVATMLANSLAAKGVHAFVIRMPGFHPRGRVDLNQALAGVLAKGRRLPKLSVHPAVDAVASGRAAVREIRRAKDVITAMPHVQGDRVGAAGVSLGAFALASAAALDDAFDPVVLFLGGADGVEVVETGLHDARRLRNHFERLGIDEAMRQGVFSSLSPGRVAHRLNPETTWMISADSDTIVRPDNARAMATGIGLDPKHHVFVRANHYTAALYLPGAVELMVQQMGTDDTDDEEATEEGREK